MISDKLSIFISTRNFSTLDANANSNTNTNDNANNCNNSVSSQTSLITHGQSSHSRTINFPISDIEIEELYLWCELSDVHIRRQHASGNGNGNGNSNGNGNGSGGEGFQMEMEYSYIDNILAPVPTTASTSDNTKSQFTQSLVGVVGEAMRMMGMRSDFVRGLGDTSASGHNGSGSIYVVELDRLIVQSASGDMTGGSGVGTGGTGDQDSMDIDYVLQHTVKDEQPVSIGNSNNINNSKTL